MLPHLADRPLNLQRFPNGAGAQGFWQKDIPPIVAQVAHDLARDRLPRARGPGRERPPGRGPRRGPVLAGQPGVVRDPRLDVDARRSRGCRPSPSSTSTPAPRRPGTRPSCSRSCTGPPSSTSASARTPSSPAAAGSRPGSRSSAAATSTPTRAPGWRSCRGPSAGRCPNLVSWEWAKAERGGKARLDYTQNAAIKTLVAPYAVRPRPGAPVSAPIRWEELDDPDAPARPLDDHDAAGARRRARRPVGGPPGGPPGPAAALARSASPCPVRIAAARSAPAARVT